MKRLYVLLTMFLFVSLSVYSQKPEWLSYNTSTSGLPSNRVLSITIDGSGNKWVGTERGLAKFDGTNWMVYNKANSGLPNNNVNSISIDSSGAKWIGTGNYDMDGSGGGLAVYKEGGVVTVK